MNKQLLDNSNSFEDSVNSNHNEGPAVNDANSLKGKLVTLLIMFENLEKEMKKNKDEIESLIKEREIYNIRLEDFTIKDKNELIKELDIVMKDMENYFERQKVENQELELKITRLKTQKTVLQGKYIALQRRIANLESQVGNEEVDKD